MYICKLFIHKDPSVHPFITSKPKIQREIARLLLISSNAHKKNEANYNVVKRHGNIRDCGIKE